ncbi:MAG: hypothetical protein V9F04_16870 [Dermatophilaceae bacterium]
MPAAVATAAGLRLAVQQAADQQHPENGDEELPTKVAHGDKRGVQPGRAVGRANTPIGFQARLAQDDVNDSDHEEADGQADGDEEQRALHAAAGAEHAAGVTTRTSRPVPADFDCRMIAAIMAMDRMICATDK